METLTEVLVDRKVLDAFKRRALELYPREFLEQIVGRVVGTQVRVYAFRELEHEATKWEVVIDEDLDPMTEGEDTRHFDILGTIHTHPQSTIEPSDDGHRIGAWRRSPAGYVAHHGERDQQSHLRRLHRQNG